MFGGESRCPVAAASGLGQEPQDATPALLLLLAPPCGPAADRALFGPIRQGCRDVRRLHPAEHDRFDDPEPPHGFRRVRFGSAGDATPDGRRQPVRSQGAVRENVRPGRRVWVGALHGLPEVGPRAVGKHPGPVTVREPFPLQVHVQAACRNHPVEVVRPDTLVENVPDRCARNLGHEIPDPVSCVGFPVSGRRLEISGEESHVRDIRGPALGIRTDLESKTKPGSRLLGRRTAPGAVPVQPPAVGKLLGEPAKLFLRLALDERPACRRSTKKSGVIQYVCRLPLPREYCTASCSGWSQNASTSGSYSAS